LRGHGLEHNPDNTGWKKIVGVIGAVLQPYRRNKKIDQGKGSNVVVWDL